MKNFLNQPNVKEDITTWALPEGAIARLERGKCLAGAFSPDEKQFAVGSAIGLWLYDVATGTPMDLGETEHGNVLTVAFSANGALLATHNWDGQLKVWDVDRRQCLFKQERGGSISQLVFSPDGKRLAAAKSFKSTKSLKSDIDIYNFQTHIYNLETQEHVASFNREEPAQTRSSPSISFSPDGNWIASTTPDGNISIWDIEAGESVGYLTATAAPVAALIFSPDGRHLITGDSEGNLLQWDVAKGTQACFAKLPTYASDGTNAQDDSTPPDWIRTPMELAYTSDGTLRAARKNGSTLIVWDVTRDEKLVKLENQRLPRLCGFSPTGSRVFFIWDNEIQLWNLGNPAAPKVLIHGHRSTCGSVKFSSDGQILAAGHWSGDGCLWDVNRLEPRTTLSCKGLDRIRCVDFSPCGDKLAAASSDKTVRVWHMSKPHAPPVELVGHQAALRAVAFSPQGDLLVSADSKGVLGVWDVQHGYAQRMWTEGTERIQSIAFSPDGDHLVCTYSQKRAQVWDVARMVPLHELETPLPQESTKYKGDAHDIKRFKEFQKQRKDIKWVPRMIAFSPCGTLLAGGVLGAVLAGGVVIGAIWVWDAATYETRMVICQPWGCRKVGAVTFSPCGRYLASGSWWPGRQEKQEKVSIRLWEVATGENLATFWAHPTDIQDLAFSPDGSLLVSGSYDGTLLLWDMKQL